MLTKGDRHMKLKLLLFVMLLATGVAGCSNMSMQKEAYSEMLRQYTKMQENRKPMVEMEAREGETIELKGVKRFAVYNTSNDFSRLPQFNPQYHPGWGLAETTIGAGLPLAAGTIESIAVSEDRKDTILGLGATMGNTTSSVAGEFTTILGQIPPSVNVDNGGQYVDNGGTLADGGSRINSDDVDNTGRRQDSDNLNDAYNRDNRSYRDSFNPDNRTFRDSFNDNREDFNNDAADADGGGSSDLGPGVGPGG